MKKKYEVIGVCPLVLPDGQNPGPGAFFEAELPLELEGFLMRIQAIREVPRPVVVATVVARPLKPVVAEEKE